MAPGDRGCHYRTDSFNRRRSKKLKIGAGLIAGEVKFDCKRCTANPKLKIENGCDEDAPIPVFEMDCIRCKGTDEECPVCKGSNKEQFYRCPYRYLTFDTVRFLRFYRFFKQGLLPVQGGVLDQSATFLRAVEIVEAEISEGQKNAKN